MSHNTKFDILKEQYKSEKPKPAGRKRKILSMKQVEELTKRRIG